MLGTKNQENMNELLYVQYENLANDFNVRTVLKVHRKCLLLIRKMGGRYY